MLENTVKIFKKLAECVGISDIDFNDQKWFEKHQWSHEEEHDFTLWLIEYLNEHPEVIPDLGEQGLIITQGNNVLATDFAISFGWDYKPKNKLSINPNNKK